MDSDYLLLLLVLGIALYIIIRISSLRQWMRLNVEMRKESGYKYKPPGSTSEFEAERKRQMDLKKHHLALRRARSHGPRKRI
jgi:hypothetical protein